MGHDFCACSQNCENRPLISSRLPLFLSVRMQQLGTQWKDFHELWYLRIFRKYVEYVQVLLKPDKNNGSKIIPFWNVEKSSTSRQATDEITRPTRALCQIQARMLIFNTYGFPTATSVTSHNVTSHVRCLPWFFSLLTALSYVTSYRVTNVSTSRSSLILWSLGFRFGDRNTR